MPWGRMDDKFWRNRKVRALRQTSVGREALGAWAYWWSWCLDDPELDGRIPKSELTLRADKRSAALLAVNGLWEDRGEYYRVHDFHQYNPTRTQVEHKREADRLRIAAERAAQRRVLEAEVDEMSRATFARVASARDPDPDPGPDRIPNPDLSLFPRAATGAEESESDQQLVRIGPEEPREAALEPLPAAAGAEDDGRHQRAAQAAWGAAEGPSLLEAELDGLTVLDDEPANEQGQPVRVIRPLDDDDPRDFAQRVRNRFQRLFEHHFSDTPYMGGKAALDFPARLASAAEQRSVEPLELLANTFAVFARSPRDEWAESYPYATFAARFSRYLNKPGAKALTPKDRLKRDMAEALAKGDRALYSELDAQYRAQFLGGRDARPAV